MGGLFILENRSAPLVGVPAETGPPPLLRMLPGDRPLVFMVEGSLLFGVEPEFFARLRSEKEAAAELVDSMRVPTSVPKAAPLPPPNAISLNIAQSCNLSCSYCYADEGRFGGRASMMSLKTARAAIDRLFDDAAGQRVRVVVIRCRKSYVG